ncbi:MAG: hypothetical protein CMJ94_11080 [Planctomycetes bacterium]|nr:hypothetical protein [Planctomycetota bacterium]|tara:strand:+ start:52 stop:507 length:456 start_codon:yes stop_codon:yes gene_type:complete
MQSKATTVPAYLKEVPEDRLAAIKKLRKTIKDNLPEGFKETMGYGMPAYVVPHKIYPDGYHCDPKLPLPFINFASQKNFVALYHMGIYANPKLLAWFEKEWPKHVSTKLDMGKSCIRFKNPDKIPFDLIGQLCQKMTVEDWVKLYEKNVKN